MRRRRIALLLSVHASLLINETTITTTSAQLTNVVVGTPQRRLRQRRSDILRDSHGKSHAFFGRRRHHQRMTRDLEINDENISRSSDSIFSMAYFDAADESDGEKKEAKAIVDDDDETDDTGEQETLELEFLGESEIDVPEEDQERFELDFNDDDGGTNASEEQKTMEFELDYSEDEIEDDAVEQEETAAEVKNNTAFELGSERDNGNADTDEQETSVDSGTVNNQLTCKSLIAVGQWRLPNESQQIEAASALHAGTDTYEKNIPFHAREEEAMETEETFVCELDNGITLPIEGTDDQMQYLRTMLNSGTIVSSEATVEVNMQTMAAIDDGDGSAADVQMISLPPGPINIIGNNSSNQENQRNRKLVSYEGEKKVLVVRVIDSEGRSVGGDAKYVSDKFFGTYGDTMTMKSGFDACSFGKFTITNDYQGQVDTTRLAAPGVVDVHINVRLAQSTQATLREAALRGVEEALGLRLPGPFDYVVLVVEDCYRIGTDCNFAAYAYINHWLSVFVADYYKYPAVQLHEIGHNLNLAHSGGLDGKTYSDHTCLMGNPLFSDDVGKMCFNPVKNYQINRGNGWYDDSQIATFDSGRSGGTSWSGKIIGVADYNNNASNHPIVIKLESGGGQDWFIGFNRATGPNADNVQADDLVTIYRVADGDGFGYSTSSLKDMLRGGQSTTISNWRDTRMNLVIRVNEINTGSSPGYAHVDISFGDPDEPPPPRGDGSPFFDWFASLPPGVAFLLLFFGTLLPCAACYCYFKTNNFTSKKRRDLYFDDKSHASDLFDAKGSPDLSYVGQIVHATLQRFHPHHHRTMWNVTSAKIIGQVHNTPRGVWDSSSDPSEGHDDWFPEKMAEIIGPTEAWCDILTLGPPDGRFFNAVEGALQKIAYRSISKTDGSPIVVRILFGHYPAKPKDIGKITTSLTKNLPEDANIHIWVGAWRKGLSWNHAKIIAVDGVFLHTGGHNMWDEPYLTKNPVHDLSLELEGQVACDGHYFANQQWQFIKTKQSTCMGFIIDKLPDALPLLKRTRVTVSEWPESIAEVFPPQFLFANNRVAHSLPQLPNNTPLISIGCQGSMVSRSRPSDDAILAMIHASRSIIRLVIQDLGPICIPGTKRPLPGLAWPKQYLDAIGKAIYERGVDIELVLSNPYSTPGGLEGKGTKDTPYGNGWDCVDVASEIIKAIQKRYATDDSRLRTMVADNLRICFVRHNQSSKYSDGNSIGLHSKHFIVDDRCCYIGSQNLYDCDLAEWGVIIDDEVEVKKILADYFVPIWRNSYTPGRDVDVARVMDGLNVHRDG